MFVLVVNQKSGAKMIYKQPSNKPNKVRQTHLPWKRISDKPSNTFVPGGNATDSYRARLRSEDILILIRPAILL